MRLGVGYHLAHGNEPVDLALEPLVLDFDAGVAQGRSVASPSSRSGSKRR